MRGTLGEVLRSERERKGITLEQVYSSTRIQLKILHALEADDYEALPAKPFIRGFIKTYARFIGLNDVELLTEYKSFIDERIHGRPARASVSSGHVFDRSEGDSSRTGLWVAMGSFLVVGAIGYLVLKPNLKSHRHGHGHGERLKAVAARSPVPEGSAQPSASPLPSGVASGLPVPSAVPSVTAVVAPVAPSSIPTVPPSPRGVGAPSGVPSSVPASPLVLAAGVTPQGQASPSSSPSPKPEKTDKMNSGADIPSAEVKVKWLVRARERVLVRFRVDDKPVSEVWVAKGRLLVLRCRQRVVMQVSNPEAVGLSSAGKSVETLAGAEPSFFQVKGANYFSGKGQGLETIEKVFDGLPKLPRTPGAEQPGASSTPET